MGLDRSKIATTLRLQKIFQLPRMDSKRIEMSPAKSKDLDQQRTLEKGSATKTLLGKDENGRGTPSQEKGQKPDEEGQKNKRSAKDWIEHPCISSEQNESAQKALNGQDSNTRGAELVSQAAGEAEQNREMNAFF